MYRWYQLPLGEVNALTSEGFLVVGKGYNFETSNGEKMVEFHVDDIPEVNIFDNKTENKLRTRINDECVFGGNLSVRKDPTEKQLLAFGHDECIFWQFIFTGMAWIGVKGELPIIPKDEGFGIMMSAFQSREFGFSFQLTSDDLKSINEYRSFHRPHYTEIDSAIKIIGSTEKKELSESPFVIILNTDTDKGKKVIGLTTTWPSNLRTVLTAFMPCSLSLTVYGFLITAAVTIEEGRTAYMLVTCLLTGGGGAVKNSIIKNCTRKRLFRAAPTKAKSRRHPELHLRK
jgi:hypothetical protein